MFRKLIPATCLLFFFVVNTISAQRQDSAGQKPKLLYILEPGSKSFMLPYIELKLNNLYEINRQEPLFSEVTGLSSLIQPEQIKTFLNDTLTAYRVIASIINNESLGSDFKDIQEVLGDYNYVLLIKTNELQRQIEFQFTLFERIKTKLVYRRNASVFVDPGKAHYQIDIIRALQNIFTEARKVPEFYIQSNIDNVDGKGLFYLSSRDSIRLDPIIRDSVATDDLLYFWSNRDTAHPLPLEQSVSRQTLRNLSPGDYAIGISVSDGINKSPLKEITLKVYEPIKLVANYDNLNYAGY